ncbi:MAG TPA: polysaccharide biosynthesis/export family protein [Planctomycetota bacterium]|nr:polysaccharide biosynthesis/export family protein [Planctomycetota bacterium]
MRSIIILLLLAVVSFPLGCSSGGPNLYPPTIRPSAFDPEQLKPVDYQVIVGDTIEIFVWQHTDLTRDIIVRPDGKLSFPLIGDIEAQGRTLTEIDDEVTKKLAEYVVAPQVSVTVKNFAGEKVIVLGEVGKPGVYKFFGRTSFMDIIAEAGGLTRDAQWGNALVIRGELKKDAEKSEIILLDVNEIINGNMRHNVVLYPRDIIYVSAKPIADVARYLRDYVSPVLGNLVSAKILSDALQKK